MTQATGGVDAATSLALDFPAVIERIAQQTTCPPGAAAVRGLQPRLGDSGWAREQLHLIDDAMRFLQGGGSLGFAGASDVREFADRAARGASLPALDLRAIALTLRALDGAVAAIRNANMPPGALAALVGTRRDCKAVTGAIDAAIDEQGQVLDSASRTLAAIRRQQQTLHAEVRERCRSIVHKPELAKMLSEPIVTVRGGRYVVPVRSEFVGQFPGVVHDQSASGGTVYIEPLASVEANNRLRALSAEEEREIARILQVLSALVGQHADALHHNSDLVARLDSIGARSRWAIAAHAGVPDLADRPLIRIVHGRHPLLRHTAVPLDFDMGEGWDAVVISGPNMGGKTVALKTIGLFVLLAYAGIPVPAAAGTTIGDFHAVHCIVGDEQSIADDLSSFSAHLRALKSAIARADGRALVLVDEIGSGTEPGAGAAIAQATIEALIRAGAKVVVTTHFTQLKTFAAAHDRVRNASMLFDPQTNAPTYVFLLGVPGQSLALSLAHAIDLDARVIARAEALLGSDVQNLERTFAQLAADREELHRRQRELDQEHDRTLRLQDGLRAKIAALDEERAAFEQRAAATLQTAVDRLRRELAERAQQRADVAQRQAAKAVPESDRLLAETLAEMRRSLGLERSASPGAPASLAPGDEVYVRTLGRNGTVAEVYDRDVLVTVGNLKTMVSRGDVVLEGAGRAVRAARAAAAVGATTTPSEAVHQVDVRGMRLDEAWPLVDKALDDAMLGGLSELRIVHGKGTGRLSRGLRDFLRDHPQVASWSQPAEREGGGGVTIVKLR